MKEKIAERVVALFQVLINITLIAIYVYFFGQTSLKKYLNKAVIISTKEETPSFIPPPGELECEQLLL